MCGIDFAALRREFRKCYAEGYKAGQENMDGRVADSASQAAIIADLQMELGKMRRERNDWENACHQANERADKLEATLVQNREAYNAMAVKSKADEVRVDILSEGLREIASGRVSGQGPRKVANATLNRAFGATP